MTIMSRNPRREFDYVEDRSWFRAQCNCLCGNGRCRCCCRGCPPCKESTFTRIVYIAFLMVGQVVMALFMSREIQDKIIDLFPENISICEWLGAGKSCHAGKLMGYLAVYRIGFAISLYHILLMLLTINVKSSKGCRGSLHNSMWIYKFMLLVVLCLGIFLIPDPEDYFIKVWMYVAMSGAALFIIVQLLLLVFMVHLWTDKIQSKINNGSSSFIWCSGMGIILFVMMYILCLSGICLLFIYFAGEGCYRNQWFISINGLACVVVSVIAAFKKDSKPWSLRLLHSSLICLYVIYLTWNAISSAPRRFQKYGLSNRVIKLPRHQRFFYCGPNQDDETMADDIIPYVSFIVTLVTVIYGALGVSERKQCRQLELPGCPLPQVETKHEKDDSGGQIIIRNEKRSLVYSYSLFHFMMALVNLLMMMHLTNWDAPSRASLKNFGRSWSAVWIKMSSSWVCIIIYFVTLLCPSILPNRRASVMPIDEMEEEAHVKANGHALQTQYDEGDDDDVDEAAVPLTPVRRPFNFVHQETTV